MVSVRCLAAMTLLASLSSFALCVASFSTDWWWISDANRANLFVYSLAFGEEVKQYSWGFICRDPLCVDCERLGYENASCDSRGADVVCQSGQYQPLSWCDQMSNAQCVASSDGWVASCAQHTDGSSGAACANVVAPGVACKRGHAGIFMMGFAVGFSFLALVISSVTFVRTVCRRSVGDTGNFAIVALLMQISAFAFCLLGFALGSSWTAELPVLGARRLGLWLSLVSTILSFASIVFLAVLIAVCCHSDSEPDDAQAPLDDNDDSTDQED